MTAFDSKPWIASYQPGVPSLIEEPSESLVDMIWTSTRLYRHKVALDFFGHTMTYGDLREQIARAANGLRKLGVGRGDRVALVLPNCPQHIVAFYAVLRLGAIVVEHNPMKRRFALTSLTPTPQRLHLHREPCFHRRARLSTVRRAPPSRGHEFLQWANSRGAAARIGGARDR